MIVRFDLEGDDVAAADIDDAGVFAGALHHELAARGQLLQVHARALIGAVLAPHHGEDAEFGVGGLAAEDIDHLLIFAGRELMLGDDFGGEGGAHASTAADACSMDWKTTRPSVEPISGSVRAFGMGHHAHHVAFAIEHAGDIAQRAVGVIDVAEGDAVFGFELVEGALVGDVAAFAVSDGQTQHLALLRRRRVGRVGGGDRQAQFAADEFEAAIADQRAGQQAGLDQDLEAVADAEHEPAIGGELADSRHHGRELGDGPAAEVIAVGEAAGEDHGIDIAERGRIVPDKLRRLPEIVGDRVKSIVIAIASGKNNDAKFHGFCFGGQSLFYQRRPAC